MLKKGEIKEKQKEREKEKKGMVCQNGQATGRDELQNLGVKLSLQGDVGPICDS